MRKIAKTNEMMERRAWRFLVATSLVVTLAAFGCTTNRYPGSGQPTNVSPSYGPLNKSVTPGASYGTEGIPPMASSYTGIPRVNVDALAILAAEQGFRGRVLGPVSPRGTQIAVPMQPFGGQVVNPAMIVNPQSTVNSSISSSPTPAITSGTTGGGVTIAAAPTATTAATTATPAVGTTAAATAAATTATTTASTGALKSSMGGGTTVAGSAVFAPALMNSTPAPSATGSVTPTLPTVVATGRAVPVSNTARATKTPTVKTAMLTTKTSTTSVQLTSGLSPIRIETGTKGQITVTNVSTAPATTPTPMTTPAPTTRY